MKNQSIYKTLDKLIDETEFNGDWVEISDFYPIYEYLTSLDESIASIVELAITENTWIVSFSIQDKDAIIHDVFKVYCDSDDNPLASKWKH